MLAQLIDKVRFDAYEILRNNVYDRLSNMVDLRYENKSEVIRDICDEKKKDLEIFCSQMQIAWWWLWWSWKVAISIEIEGNISVIIISINTFDEKWTCGITHAFVQFANLMDVKFEEKLRRRKAVKLRQM